MFNNVRLSLFFAVSLLLAPAAESCASKKPAGGAGQANTAAPTNTAAPVTGTDAQLKQTQRRSRVLYHGVHPGSAGGDETTVDDLAAYVREAGKDVAFVYITQELNADWLNDTDDATAFPTRQVSQIRDHGAIPFIRLMTRKTSENNEDTNLEDIYTYDILVGDPAVKLPPKDEATKQKFRRRMLAWAKAAGDQPLFVEWGTEVNGKWFWWNAWWYADEPCRKRMRDGKPPDAACRERLLEGTQKFRLAFKSLRGLVNVEGKVSNVKWAFHVASGSDPNPKENEGYDWNSIENYYPGEGCPECVDVVGVSAYGAQKRGDGCDDSFEAQLNRLLKGDGSAEHDSLKRIAQSKRVFVLEFGHTLISGEDGKPDPRCDPAGWTRAALDALFDADKWPGVTIAGFSWWNEAWVEVEKKSKSVTDMRLQHFDLCREDEEEAGKVRKVLPCECWTRDASKCYDLRGRRDRLRTSFNEKLKEYKDSLRTRPDAEFLR